MISINSNDATTRVVNSRASKKSPYVWRRRQGRSGEPFTTYERPALSENKRIAHPDQSTTVFNLGKLLLSIAASFTHNRHSAEYDSLWLAQTIEMKLSIDTAPLTLATITDITHQTLRQFDEVAALQYAAKHNLISGVRKRGRPSVK